MMVGGDLVKRGYEGETPLSTRSVRQADVCAVLGRRRRLLGHAYAETANQGMPLANQGMPL